MNFRGRPLDRAAQQGGTDRGLPGRITIPVFAGTVPRNRRFRLSLAAAGRVWYQQACKQTLLCQDAGMTIRFDIATVWWWRPG